MPTNARLKQPKQGCRRAARTARLHAQSAASNQNMPQAAIHGVEFQSFATDLSRQSSPAALCTRGDHAGWKPSQFITCPSIMHLERLRLRLQAGHLGGRVPAAHPARAYHGAGAAAGAAAPAPALGQGGPSEQSTRPPLGRLMHDAHTRVTAAPPLLASTSLRGGRQAVRLPSGDFTLPASGAISDLHWPICTRLAS